MKPLTAEIADQNALQDLGRAAVQILHDVKNQLNGLKLYATFLRKRMEKGNHPEDERETVAKLIAGLERAAGDLTALVRYARPIELRRQPRVDLCRIIARIASEKGTTGVGLASESGALEGEFDLLLITEALAAITAGSQNMRASTQGEPLTIHLRRMESEQPAAIVEWRGVRPANGYNPFHSFAGSDALRMCVAAKIVEAHGGEAGHTPDGLHIRLPLGASSAGGS